ncbi:four-carbon acid sugar kinase family protein [Paenibacillus whitsoniae]|uniref:Four-carbon acid sugar kinase family protein n=1 Tax=Paenibacillus whitsoniae TaxID=2496558 RepID=A0A3S0AF58_9BACL|nr:four-carbon acid sugar kinase family protein [Paenibacillus whitsoniae]RTE11506.1 four-carbon acid sugar kinase family protein [Paenibacillus whitsoniae]
MADHKREENRRLLCYYGDDFTGSTDVLESLFAAGLKTVLFLEPPTTEQLETRFRDVDCFGVAGVGRSMTPEEMDRELRPIFRMLKASGAAVVHYKICSTFDSSPGIGSIGKAAEIGREVFGGRFIPLLAGVPYLGRYTVFGQHFAAGGGVGGGPGAVHRLDRHPTMSRHPITPMAEADLLRHLRQQTVLPSALLDIRALDGTEAEVQERLEALLASGEQPAELVLFDVLDERRLETAGRLIWDEAERGDGLFVIGSSGVEYALGAVWRRDRELGGVTSTAAGAIEGASDAAVAGAVLPSAEPCAAGAPIAPAATSAQRSPAAPSPLLVISGSCSPVTEGQIARALETGFHGLRVPVEKLIRAETRAATVGELLSEARDALESGRSVIVYSAAGPQDASIDLLRDLLAAQGLRSEDSSRLLGSALGLLTKALVQKLRLPRVLIAGGDTSGYVTRELGIYALACKAVLDPGGPLCRAYAAEAPFDGLELVLKGGQVGSPDFFAKVAAWPCE